MTVTAINVFIELDGKQYIAPIDPEIVRIFMGMLGAYQRDQPSGAQLILLHEDIASHLLQLRRALHERITALQKKKQQQPAGTLQADFQEGRTS